MSQPIARVENQRPRIDSVPRPELCGLDREGVTTARLPPALLLRVRDAQKSITGVWRTVFPSGRAPTPMKRTLLRGLSPSARDLAFARSTARSTHENRHAKGVQRWLTPN